MLATPDYDPTDEKWQFKPGEIVKCIDKMINGKKAIVAIQKVN